MSDYNIQPPTGTKQSIVFIGHDDNGHDGTIDWYDINGTTWGMLNGDTVLDCDGCPVEPCNDHGGVFNLIQNCLHIC